jgi:glycerol uptake facilitator-like aquaporin
MVSYTEIQKMEPGDLLQYVASTVIGFFIGALLCMLLWNALLTSYFELSQINYLEAIGIRLLCGILFK